MNLSILLLGVALAAPPKQVPAPMTRQVIVKAKAGRVALLEARMREFAPDATRSRAFPRLKEGGAVGLDRVFVLEAPTEARAELISALSADPSVEWVEANSAGGGLTGGVLFPDDPDFGLQWALDQPNDIDADVPEAWSRQGGVQVPNDVLVAIIDTGFDLDSGDPEWEGVVWTNPGEIAGDGLDNDGNGFIDDVHGYDFAGNDSDTNTDHPHGVQVTGIVAARANNGSRVAGIASGVRIMPVKAFQFGLFPFAGPYAGHLAPAAAITYAVDNGAQIINSSWFTGTTPSKVVNDAVDYAIENGVHMIFSAGNFGVEQTWPAEHENVIGVAAVDSEGKRSIWSGPGNSSNFGTWVDVSAGGTGIVTTFEYGLSSFSGTSAAAPIVSAIAALVVARDPNLAPHELRALIGQAAVNVDSLNPGFEGKLGAGFANADRSLALLEPVSDLGFATSGIAQPVLNAWGGTNAGETSTLSVSGALPDQGCALIVGRRRADAKILGGHLVPAEHFVFSGRTSEEGRFYVEFELTEDLPTGFVLYAQFAVRDSGAPANMAFSNAVKVEVP